VVIRAVIGDDCRVEDGAVAEESVLLPGAKLGAGESAFQKIVTPWRV
jgi:NDP-sugar pyrophosphorylase family protein